ncbi:blast:78 kDa glucose-regulated protein [Drosophila guanche]|uniref:Blast:78 kDa glucose-regulated protein n=1 Tax=Drosophila guanche TaxID=7266 RepID=A0A3B0K1E5_DROGU|nr:blast:78 kDa glucose-regulated protein [Drosophila guanche]
MKQTAEDFLGRKITDAVVTVPARFNDAQRQATKNCQPQCAAIHQRTNSRSHGLWRASTSSPVDALTRAKFEELSQELFRSTLQPVQTLLEDAQLQKTDVDEIVLIGGFTRIPKIQQLVEDFFDGKQLFMRQLIPGNTLIPTKKTRSFFTANDNQSFVTIQVYEGERPLTQDNHLLGTF